jgi:hypothetical protein
MQPESGELLTAPQAGLILGKSGPTVLRWAKAGRLPVAVKVPGPKGEYLFARAEVEALADELARSAS